MRACVWSVFSVALASLFFAGCTPNVDAEAEAAKSIVDDFWRAIRDQDGDLLSRVIAQDEEMVIFGTDAVERWIGSSAFLSAEKEMMQAFDVEHLNRLEDTFQIHENGGVAWFSTVFDIDVSVGDELTSMKGLRTTGVLEKRKGNWVIVQAHTSVPVAGQQFEY